MMDGAFQFVPVDREIVRSPIPGIGELGRPK